MKNKINLRQSIKEAFVLYQALQHMETADIRLFSISKDYGDSSLHDYYTKESSVLFLSIGKKLTDHLEQILKNIGIGDSSSRKTIITSLINSLGNYEEISYENFKKSLFFYL